MMVWNSHKSLEDNGSIDAVDIIQTLKLSAIHVLYPDEWIHSLFETSWAPCTKPSTTLSGSDRNGEWEALQDHEIAVSPSWGANIF